MILMNEKEFREYANDFLRKYTLCIIQNYKIVSDEPNNHRIYISDIQFCECDMPTYVKFSDYMKERGYYTHFYINPKNKKKIEIVVSCWKGEECEEVGN